VVRLLVLCFNIALERARIFFSAEAQDFGGLVKTAHFDECRCNQVFISLIISVISKYLHVRILAVVLIT